MGLQIKEKAREKADDKHFIKIYNKLFCIKKFLFIRKSLDILHDKYHKTELCTLINTLKIFKKETKLYTIKNTLKGISFMNQIRNYLFA